MNTLFAFDSSLEKEKLKKLRFGLGRRVILCPLTSKQSLVNEVFNFIKGIGYKPEILDIGEFMHQAADEVKGKYLKFVTDVPYIVKRNGRNLKEVFALDETSSLWWFSLIAEKSTYKSDSINNLIKI